MAHISMRRQQGGGHELVVNDVDLSSEIYRGLELVEVGDDPETAEVGLRVTLAVGSLDLDNETNVQVTDRLPAIAQRVRSIQKEA